MFPKAYRTLQYLSIDIVIGAVVLLHFFSQPFEVSLPWASYVLLGCAVWVIYTVDHLKDAKKSAEPRRARYDFHLRHERVLKFFLLGVLCLAGFCLSYLPYSILIFGAGLSVLCSAYLLFQSQLAKVGLKECYVAVMYAFGILISPMGLSQSFDLLSFAGLFILAFTNLLLFSWFENSYDEKDGFDSVATTIGGPKTGKLIWTIISLGLALSLIGFQVSFTTSIYLVAVLLIYWLLLTNRNWATQNERYRMIGDGVFILPILFELL